MTKDNMEEAFLRYLEDIFQHPEIISAAVRDIVITRETRCEAGKQAFEAGFHDIYSDIDLSVKVNLPKNGSVTPEDYMKRIDRFGVTKDTALGWMFVPINKMYRIIFKSGMRYDFGFDFVHEGEDPVVLEPYATEEENANWPLDNINRFWFIQVQALGKLYRKDYLISSHLANMNCNDTLVMQMILRDIKYGTNHHRYGYSEELEYIKELGKTPYRTDDPTFNRIADHLYAAAISYDRLAKNFYPEYQNRSYDFFTIWDCYHSGRNEREE
ncbi:MAG: hypothetical protein E7254_00015 [Lachnospiraceae bacterium]|nr:hypothetical protein [Lachnospiraceae bacterium]